MIFCTDSSRAGRSRSAGAQQTTALVATWSDDRRESDGCRALQVLGSACGIGSGPTCVPRDHRPVATYTRPGPVQPDRCIAGLRAPRREVTASPAIHSQLTAGRAPSSATATHTRPRSSLDRVGSPVPSGGFSHASGEVGARALLLLLPRVCWRKPAPPTRSHFFRPAASSRVQGMAARPGSSVVFTHSLIGRRSRRVAFPERKTLQHRDAPHRSRPIGFRGGATHPPCTHTAPTP